MNKGIEDSNFLHLHTFATILIAKMVLEKNVWFL
jgi:hypothetical protein